MVLKNDYSNKKWNLVRQNEAKILIENFAILKYLTGGNDIYLLRDNDAILIN